ncbi:hypothetical protein ACIBH1_41845 [Nonomuraea sp. NPDC050663]|uniref:hypothetical protein n=1 Tax=Nonomuraea sp. NPDC050663 TaxID=3364370 RepID=UPI0037AA722D
MSANTVPEPGQERVDELIDDLIDDLEIHAATPVEPELVVVRKQLPPDRASLI